MGSFNVACGASNLSINSGDPVIIIPLKYNRKEPNLSGSNIISNDGSCALFVPATLPIRAVYDDYGRVTNINESPTTKLIEEKTGESISTWMNNLLSYDHDTSDKLVTNAAMFVHGDIYDFLIQDDIFAGEGSVANNMHGCFHVLEELGFKKHLFLDDSQIVQVDNYHGLTRHRQLWKHNSSEQYFIASDSGEAIIFAQAKGNKFDEVHGWVFSLDDMRDVWKGFTQHSFDIEKYKTESFQIREISAAINNYRKNIINKYAKEHLTYIFGLNQYRSSHLINFYLPIIGGSNQESLMVLLKEISNYRHFIDRLCTNNRLLMPTFNGIQFGDYEASKNLAMKIAEISFKEIVKQNS